MSVPATMSGSGISGLLGNNNGDPTDDHRLPDGVTVLPADPTQEQIYEFGEKCMYSQLFVSFNTL